MKIPAGLAISGAAIAFIGGGLAVYTITGSTSATMNVTPASVTDLIPAPTIQPTPDASAQASTEAVTTIAPEGNSLPAGGPNIAGIDISGLDGLSLDGMNLGGMDLGGLNSVIQQVAPLMGMDPASTDLSALCGQYAGDKDGLADLKAQADQTIADNPDYDFLTEDMNAYWDLMGPVLGDLDSLCTQQQ